jgi:TPR repeat protein
MRALSVIILLAVLVLQTVAFAEDQTFTATHSYILGDHDSKDDARQRCLLETKRKILEQAGVYIESASEVKNFDLTQDKITSFAAAVMQVKDTKEEVSFQQGHMTMTLKLTAQVDLAEVRKQLAARQLDAGMRDDVAAQKERLKYLEAQFETMQRQQGGQSSGHTTTPPASEISAKDLEMRKTRAAQGDAEAQTQLGFLYGAGYGVPQDYVQEAKWYEKAAAQGNPMAQNQLGWLYVVGEGVSQDFAKARQWFEKAAAQGDAQAQYGLGGMYANGYGVQRDYVKARQWYEKAAAQGDAQAQDSLGVLYGDGKGVPQDCAKAGQWHEKAAAQGNAKAQLNLGVLYVGGFGCGVPQDYKKAGQWWEKAAAQGHAEAQHYLGGLYHNGQGVPRDDVRAYMWLNLAAAHSTDSVKKKVTTEYRDTVARGMTPAQISEAQRLSQQCQTQQFKGC